MYVCARACACAAPLRCVRHTLASHLTTSSAVCMDHGPKLPIAKSPFSHAQIMFDGIDRTANDVAEMQQDDLCVEVIKHLQFCNHRGNSHEGREVEVGRVRHYLQGIDGVQDSNQILTLFGGSGSGKTSIMAQSCIEAYHMSLSGGNRTMYNATIVVRFIGCASSHGICLA